MFFTPLLTEMSNKTCLANLSSLQSLSVGQSDLSLTNWIES